MSERRLLFMMKPEQLEAFLRLQQAAERGDGGAACRLGDMYREGVGGLRYSPTETYRWYAKSALAGDANGQNNLGACCEHGLGCAQSYAKAVKWYRLSVAQGLSTASMNLGYCYLRGHGVAADKAEALRLFREAVEGGEERAQQEVERLEADRGITRPTLVASGPGPVSTEACPREHAVAAPPPPWKDEDLRLELLEVLDAVTERPVDGVVGPTEDEVFLIFAEGGMRPEDLVEGVAERYAACLAFRSPAGAGST
jgi:hypothetical protein